MTPEFARERLADQVYAHLRQQILNQELRPGDRLSVPAVAKRLQLSRSPVREAVQRLVQEGLGTERARHGAVVAAPDIDSLIDLYAVRAELEGLAAALTATDTVPDLVGELRELLDEHRSAYERRDHAGVIHADVRFHDRIGAASGNAELGRVLGPIQQRMTIAMLAGNSESWPAKALDEHRAVVDAIADGKPDDARRLMRRHIHRVRDDLTAQSERSGT